MAIRTAVYEFVFAAEVDLPDDPDDWQIPGPIVLQTSDIEGFGDGWELGESDPYLLIVDESTMNADSDTDDGERPTKLSTLCIRLAERTGNSVMMFGRYVSPDGPDRGFGGPLYIDPSAPPDRRFKWLRTDDEDDDMSRVFKFRLSHQFDGQPREVPLEPSDIADLGEGWSLSDDDSRTLVVTVAAIKREVRAHKAENLGRVFARLEQRTGKAVLLTAAYILRSDETAEDSRDMSMWLSGVLNDVTVPPPA